MICNTEWPSVYGYFISIALICMNQLMSYGKIQYLSTGLTIVDLLWAIAELYNFGPYGEDHARDILECAFYIYVTVSPNLSSKKKVELLVSKLGIEAVLCLMKELVKTLPWPFSLYWSLSCDPATMSTACSIAYSLLYTCTGSIDHNSRLQFFSVAHLMITAVSYVLQRLLLVEGHNTTNSLVEAFLVMSIGLCNVDSRLKLDALFGTITVRSYYFRLLNYYDDDNDDLDIEMVDDFRLFGHGGDNPPF